MNDTDLGTFALQEFWKAALALNPALPGNFQDFMEIMRRAYYPKDTTEAPQGYTSWKSIYYPLHSSDAFAQYVDGVGVALRSVGYDQDQGKIVSAMQALATKGNGQIPTNGNSFFSAVQDQAQNFNFYDAAAFVVVESAKDIGAGVQAAGNAIISTGKGILAYKNVILIGAAALVGFVLFERFGKKKV